MVETTVLHSEVVSRSRCLAFTLIIFTSTLITAVFYSVALVGDLLSSHPNFAMFSSDKHQSTAHINVVFSEHENYQNLSHVYDSLWKQLLAPNGGFLIRTDGNQQHRYGISMYHQLHCLQMIRTAIQDLQGVEPVSGSKHDSNSHMQHHKDQGPATNAHPGPDHYLHCLDYLRQVSTLARAGGNVEANQNQTEADTTTYAIGNPL